MISANSTASLLKQKKKMMLIKNYHFLGTSPAR